MIRKSFPLCVDGFRKKVFDQGSRGVEMRRGPTAQVFSVCRVCPPSALPRIHAISGPPPRSSSCNLATLHVFSFMPSLCLRPRPACCLRTSIDEVALFNAIDENGVHVPCRGQGHKTSNATIRLYCPCQRPLVLCSDCGNPSRRI